jgi:hypothetical protein
MVSFVLVLVLLGLLSFVVGLIYLLDRQIRQGPRFVPPGGNQPSAADPHSQSTATGLALLTAATSNDAATTHPHHHHHPVDAPCTHHHVTHVHDASCTHTSHDCGSVDTSSSNSP